MNIKLLDCTLRDGGHVIESAFGEQMIKGIVSKLVKSNVEIIELGFLRNVEYNSDIAVYSHISQAEKIIEGYEKTDCEFSLLAQQDQYDYEKLPDNNGKINYIRVSFHINDRMEGLSFCKKVKEKGYKCCCNPINIMGYSDTELLEMIELVNEIEPYAFTIVDTFGSMQQEDLIRIYLLLSNHLKPQINIAIHLHENMSQSYSLAQEMTKMNLGKRELIIDASLRGMGRVPGNLPIELMMDYLNKFLDKNYKIEHVLDAIDNYINAFYYKILWGYDPVYSLAAQYNLHRTYAEYLKETGKLGTKDIQYILQRIPLEKRTLYDKEYIHKAYMDYVNVSVDDDITLEKLKKVVNNKDVLVIANGHSIIDESAKIDEFINEHPDAIIISAHFYCRRWAYDFAFFSNIRRYTSILDKDYEKTILCSNLIRDIEGKEMIVNYERLKVEDERVGDNCLIMILKLLNILSARKIYLAGFDGYSTSRNDYFLPMYDNIKQPEYINRCIKECLNQNFSSVAYEFLTKSLYED